MEKITNEIKELLETQKLGFVATISPDNTPNVSPKGTIIPWDDNLVFADIKSPQTMSNLEKNNALEINVVDPIKRKGFRFKGTGTILKDGSEYEKIITHYTKLGIKSKINAVVLVKVELIRQITSPLYDLGFTEDEISSKWKNHYLKF